VLEHPSLAQTIRRSTSGVRDREQIAGEEAETGGIAAFPGDLADMHVPKYKAWPMAAEGDVQTGEAVHSSCPRYGSKPDIHGTQLAAMNSKQSWGGSRSDERTAH
jgi:hypothetical protein